MNQSIVFRRSWGFGIRLVTLTLAAIALSGIAQAAEPATLTVRVDQQGPKFDPIFYGLMTEEINYSYDGGLYAELIRNRIFQDRPIVQGGRGGGRGRGATNPAATQQAAAPAPTPAPATPAPASNPAVAKNPNLINWWLVTGEGASGDIDIDTNNPVNTIALTNSLRLDIKSVGQGKRVGVANDGYWGIPVKPNTEYTASFYARAGQGFSGPLTVGIESNDGKITYASGQIASVGTGWQKHILKLKTAQVQPTAEARFVISATQPGSVWLSLVSLFPPTYKNRPNGNRIDISELLAGMKPAFLRFPGGNYLEGPNFENRFDWKKTIGPLEERAGHMSPWRYRSSDGMGLLEFLLWCEDLNMEPIVGVYAGLHIDGGRGTLTGDALKPHVQEALDEIEYIMGDVSTTWGARRAKDGHPAPFKLRYVEIGNEDWLNGGLQNYAGRFAMIYDAIRAKYPNLKIISSMRSRDRYNHDGRIPDLLDDHDYMTIPTALNNTHRYDTYDRNGIKIFAGEWATNNPGSNPRGGPTGHMAFALGDAAWLTSLERNCDVIVMHCYAPLFCNINPGGMQWAINLIGYDAVNSFGSPAYYVQKMFANNRGDAVIPSKLDPLPKLTADQIPQAPVQPGGGGGGGRGPATNPTYDGVYAVATKDDASGDIILKLVNVQSTPQPLKIDLQGAPPILKDAKGEVLAGELGGMNSVTEPMKFAPRSITLNNVGPSFTHELPAHSVSVIRLKTR